METNAILIITHINVKVHIQPWKEELRYIEESQGIQIVQIKSL